MNNLLLYLHIYHLVIHFVIHNGQIDLVLLLKDLNMLLQEYFMVYIFYIIIIGHTH